MLKSAQLAISYIGMSVGDVNAARCVYGHDADVPRGHLLLMKP